MKTFLFSLISDNDDPIAKRNTVREYLQVRILEALQHSGAMLFIAFQGGTALRLLYGLQRFSEDLDFSLERPDPQFDFKSYLNDLRKIFTSEAYDLSIKEGFEKTVNSAFLRFTGLPYELGLSPNKNENLSIKIEIDTQPPDGAIMESTIVRKYVYLNLFHHDRASLFAGKLHALFQRKFTKGRDIYDLMWYLSDPKWPEPNFVLLKNALIQTGWQKDFPNRDNWIELIQEKMKLLDWNKVISDVRPFLENQDEIAMFTKKNLFNLIRNKKS